MNIFLYTMIFIAGTVFGSFCTLAVYRIPRKENITYVRSHCTSCNHKLSFIDLIPILSYIFLGGKCRYCKEKIRSRYIILEISSGLVFLLIALSLKINIYSTLIEFINLFIIYLFVTGVFIIGGIEKENYIIPNSLIIYIYLISCINVIKKIIINMSILNNILGLIIIPVILLIINFILKLNNKNKISSSNIKYISAIGFFMGIEAQIITLIVSQIGVLVGVLMHKYEKIPFGYYISIATIIIIIFNNYQKEIIEFISIK